MARRDDIIVALKQLSTTDDKNWTEDGLPVLEALGVKDLKRDEVTKLAPFFTRQNPSFEQKKAEAPAEKKKKKEDLTQDIETKEELQQALAKMEEELVLFNKVKKELTEKLDAIISSEEKEVAAAPLQDNISSFLKSQHEQRMSRAKGREMIREAGIRLEDLQDLPINRREKK